MRRAFVLALALFVFATTRAGAAARDCSPFHRQSLPEGTGITDDWNQIVFAGGVSADVFLGRPRDLCILTGTRLLIISESARAVLIDTALRTVVDTIEGWRFTVSPSLRWLIYTRFYPAATTVSTTDQLLYYDLQAGVEANRSKDASGETVVGRILFPRYKGLLPPNTGMDSENDVSRTNLGTWTEDGAGFLVAYFAKTPILVLVDFSNDRPVVSTHEITTEKACEPNTLLPDADGFPQVDTLVLTRFSPGNFQIIAKYRYEWCRGRAATLRSDEDFIPARDH